MQDEREHCCVKLSRLDRQALQFTLPQIDVGRAAQAKTRRVEHVHRAVDRNHLLHVRSNDFRQLPGAAAEIADYESRVDETEHAPEKEGVAEQIAAQAIPVARG